MTRSLPIPRRRRWLRRSVGAVLLIAFAASSVPIPLPQFSVDSVPANDVSPELTGGNHVCGCCSTARCGKTCCCSRGQKNPVAARDSGIEPLRVIVTGDPAATQLDSHHSGKTAAKPGTRKNNRGKTSRDSGYVIASFVSACRGTPWGISSLPWAVVPPPRGLALARQRDEFPRAMSVTADSLSLEPPEPPPRVTATLS